MSETTAVARAAPAQPLPDVIEQALIKGDFSKLTSEQRTAYVRTLCESLGLNFLTRPFGFFTSKGRGGVTITTLYARKDCADQLRKLHGVTLEITGHEVVFGDCMMVSVMAKMTHGKTVRHDTDVGVVCVSKLAGEDKANALMKAVTKAKRRVTLSICGLGGIPDESELEDSPNAELPRLDTRLVPPPALVAPEVHPAAASAATKNHTDAPPVATAAQIAEVKALKAECGLNGESWVAFLQNFHGQIPSSMSEAECGQFIAALKHRRDADHLEAGMRADGLPTPQPPSGGQPNGTTFRQPAKAT